MTSLAGLGPLAKLAVRRDRGILPAWLYILLILVAGSAYSIKKVYPTAASRDQFAATVPHNPALLFMYGPVYGHSLGGITAWKPGVLTAVLAALMSVFLVIRHTRADEEAGRLELIGSTAVGRQAPLAASLLVALAASLVLAVLLTAALAAVGFPAAGSLGYALAVAGCGAAFAGVAAVAAQVAATARGARGLAIAVAAACYLLRAFGDSAGPGGPNWLGWLSPFGWAEQVRPYGGDRWWLLLPLAALAVVTLAAGWALSSARDHGAGLLPQRPGRPQASRLLDGPEALAWRLQRGALAGWAVGFAALGLASGASAKGVGSLIGGSEQLRHAIARLGGQTALANAYLAAIMSIAGILAAAYATATLLRLRSEETAELADPVLATGTGRIRWALSHVGVAVLGTALLLACAGVCAGIGYGARGGDLGGQVASLLGAALAQMPAALAVAAVAVVAFGLRPGWSVACGWGALAVAGLLVLFGPALSLSTWVLDISPFTHLPKLPGEPVSAPPLAWLCVAALAMGVAGMAGLRRRDIA
ncbi:MAG TPA: ABC transporter permease [Streptosporangiaceae bacterium]